jgi:DNA polymerase III epsilon subunit-like protein
MTKLIFLDTESTGNEIGKDRLCQVCYRTEKETKTEYFKPPLPVSVKAMSVTHITNKMLADKPAFIGSTMFKELQKLLIERVLVAHNAKFDQAILEAEGLKVPQFICTLRVARYLDTENIIPEYNLQYLRYYLDIDVPGNAHDAEADVNVLEALFSRLLAKVKEETKDEEKAIKRMIEISSTPTLFKKFNFGKYKDKTLDEVVDKDSKYLEWLLKEKMKTPEQEEDWIYTLEHYLNINN